MYRFFALLAWIMVISPESVRGDVESGPKPGAKVSAFKVLVPSSDGEAKERDPVTERKNKTTLYVFIDAKRFDRPTARCLHKLDSLLPSDQEDKEVIAVWLTADHQDSKDKLPRYMQSLKLNRTDLTIFTQEGSSPEGWDINENALATAVVVSSGKVTASMGFDSFNETDAEKLLAAFKKAAKNEKPNEKSETPKSKEKSRL
jgi:hypothetical protein